MSEPGLGGAAIRYDPDDIRFMSAALKLAAQAGEMGETPVGAVVVQNGTIVGSGHNKVESLNDASSHAEINALREASMRNGNWRLRSASLYVTLEPCIMCAGAVLQFEIRRVIFGAYNDRWGGLGSLFDFAHDPRINREIQITSGVLKEESAELLHNFFERLRATS